MNPIELLRRRPLIVIAALGASLGAVLGLLRPITPDSAERAGNELAWQLPPIGVVSRFDERQFMAVNGRRIWGATASGAAGAQVGADGKSALPWRLTGIILEPVPIALVLAEGSLSVSRVGIGETLPGGGTLLSVAATAIAYRHDGCERERHLYGDPAQQPEPACVADPVDPAPQVGKAEAH